jgi:hypothetical protein
MRPTIVTSSWFEALPREYCRIGISRGTPRGQRGFLVYRKLQPGPGTLKLPDAEFTSHYVRQVLGKLDAQQVVDELLKLADGRTPAILCFEHAQSDAWCHRAIVSAWLEAELGLEVPEFGREADGHGAAHPKLCAQARAILLAR